MGQPWLRSLTHPTSQPKRDTEARGFRFARTFSACGVIRPYPRHGPGNGAGSDRHSPATHGSGWQPGSVNATVGSRPAIPIRWCWGPEVRSRSPSPGANGARRGSRPSRGAR